MPGPSGDADGDPYTLVDAQVKHDMQAVFKELREHVESTDGCGGQFQGEANIGEVARARLGLTKVVRYSVIGVSAHGKGVGDGLCKETPARIQEGIMHGRLVQSGTRNHVLYLAQYHPSPVEKDDMKEGLWAPQRIFYGFYDKSLFKSPKHFAPYTNSEPYHSRVGLCEDPAAVARDGPIIARKAFCGSPCCRVGGPSVGALMGCRVTEATGVPLHRR